MPTTQEKEKILRVDKRMKGKRREQHRRRDKQEKSNTIRNTRAEDRKKKCLLDISHGVILKFK